MGLEGMFTKINSGYHKLAMYTRGSSCVSTFHVVFGFSSQIFVAWHYAF